MCERCTGAFCPPNSDFMRRGTGIASCTDMRPLLLAAFLPLLPLASCSEDESAPETREGFCNRWAEAACSGEVISACQAADEDACRLAQEGLCLDLVPRDGFSGERA